MNKDSSAQMTTSVIPFNREEFTNLGIEEVVYVEEVSEHKAQRLFPDIEDWPDHGPFFVVRAANSTPIILATDIDEAVDTALSYDLHVLQRH